MLLNCSDTIKVGTTCRITDASLSRIQCTTTSQTYETVIHQAPDLVSCSHFDAITLLRVRHKKLMVHTASFKATQKSNDKAIFLRLTRIVFFKALLIFLSFSFDTANGSSGRI